jgi:hypothetical protein
MVVVGGRAVGRTVSLVMQVEQVFMVAAAVDLGRVAIARPWVVQVAPVFMAGRVDLEEMGVALLRSQQ